MQKTFYFMAGLPRSGSTLISSILNQNPRFYSGPSSPVLPTMMTIESSLANCELFRSYPKPDQAQQIIGSVLPQFYSDREELVIFDKNRAWTNHIEYIRGYFDLNAKVICPVRNIDEILTSFISMVHRNPTYVEGKINFIDEMLVKNNVPVNDDTRCEFLASMDGILGQSVEGLRKVFIDGYDQNIHLVEYNDLISDPQGTMDRIYDFLDEEYFTHNFENIKNINRENDTQVYGFEDMHKVHKSLQKVSKDPKEVLSESILERCVGAEFWRIAEGQEEKLPKKFAPLGLETESNFIG